MYMTECPVSYNPSVCLHCITLRMIFVEKVLRVFCSICYCCCCCIYIYIWSKSESKYDFFLLHSNPIHCIFLSLYNPTHTFFLSVSVEGLSLLLPLPVNDRASFHFERWTSLFALYSPVRDLHPLTRHWLGIITQLFWNSNFVQL